MKNIKRVIIGLLATIFFAHIEAAKLDIINRTGQQLRAEVIWNSGSWWYPVNVNQKITFSSPWNKDITMVRWVDNGLHYTWRIKIPTISLKTAWCQIFPKGVVRFQIGSSMQLITVKSDEENTAINNSLYEGWNVID